MAEILKCSCPTIHSVECGRLKLSEKLAMRIAHETGVAVDWLLAGDPGAPALDQSGNAYTTQTYFAWRAKRRSLVDPFQAELSEFQVKFALGNFQRALDIIFKAAHAKREVPLAAYKISKAINDWQKEFGVPEGAGAERPEVFMAALGSNSWTQHLATLRRRQFFARRKKNTRGKSATSDKGRAVKQRSGKQQPSAKRKRAA